MRACALVRGILIIGYGSILPYAEQAMKEQCKKLANLRKKKSLLRLSPGQQTPMTDVMKVIASDSVDELFAISFFIIDGEITKERLPKEISLQRGGNGTINVNGRKST